jgi:hypothetical protein
VVLVLGGGSNIFTRLVAAVGSQHRRLFQLLDVPGLIRAMLRVTLLNLFLLLGVRIILPIANLFNFDSRSLLWSVPYKVLLNVDLEILVILQWLIRAHFLN